MSVEATRTGLRGALLALLLLSPLPFGSVEPWAVLALELSAAAVGAVALYLVALDPAVLESRARMALALGGTVVVIGVVQLVPLPGGWSRLVASPTQALREQLARFLPEVSATVTPQSLEPPATSDALLRFAAYVLIGLAAVVAVRTPAHLRQVAVVIAASGAFQAIYGSAEYLTGHQHIFGYAKKFYADEASGTFINRNHFAGYLAMTLPFALGLMLDSARSLPDARSLRERLLQLGETGGLRLALSGAAAAAIWIGVILSYSRGGLAVALAGTAFLAYRLSLRRKRAWLLVAALLIPTALLMWSQVRAPGERFVSESSNLASFGGRLPVWNGARRIVPAYWELGTGLGTFQNSFELVRPPAVTGDWDHAHNDWMESIIEGGLFSFGSLALLVFLTLYPRSRADDLSHQQNHFHAAACAAVVTISLFSLSDFSLRIPANAMLVAIATCLAASHATHARSATHGTVLLHRG